jgi:predicted 2-oxoglutarate/Fe(II)-dependent dioxygenase YbiX
MEIERLGAGVFVIHDFLNPEECVQYIQESENIGFSEAVITTEDGERIFKDARNNDRIVYDNPELAHKFFQRSIALLPPSIDGWSLHSFNERFRFYRYQNEQFFKLHMDGTFRRHDSEESFLTFLIYLNDDFVGGHTDFVWESVKPKAGSVLVFPHRLMHQGSIVTSGVKYVLRTDVLYRQEANTVKQSQT